MDLPWLDACFTLLLLGGLIGVGYWAQRLTRSVAHFTVAGREMGMWLGLSAGVAEGTGLISIANNSQQGFKHGFSYIWLGMVGLVLIHIPLFGLMGLGIKRFRATKVQTLPQFYEMRFNRKVRIFAGITLALGGTLNLAIFPIVGSMFLMEFLGIANAVLVDLGFFQFMTFHLVLLIVLSLACFFTMIGGMVGVVLTDYLQSVILFISITIITILVLNATGLAGIRDAVEDNLGNAAFNPLSTKSLGPVFVIVFLIGGFVNRLAFPPQLQKFSSAKSPEVVRKMFLLSLIFSHGRGMAFALVGIAALAILGAAIPEGYDPEVYHRVVGARLLRMVTAGVPLLKGITLTGFLFAFISTVDSYLLSWATVVANDCVCTFRKEPLSGKKHVALLRWCSVGLAAFIFLFGCWYDPKQTILQYFYLTGVIFGACGLLTWFGLYWKRSTSAGAWVCLVLGLSIPVSWFIFQKHFMPDDVPKWVNNDNAALLGALLPALAMVVVSFFTKHDRPVPDYGKMLRDMEANG